MSDQINLTSSPLTVFVLALFTHDKKKNVVVVVTLLPSWYFAWLPEAGAACTLKS